MPEDKNQPPPKLDYATPRDDEPHETWGEFWRALGVVLLLMLTLLALYVLISGGLSLLIAP